MRGAQANCRDPASARVQNHSGRPSERTRSRAGPVLILATLFGTAAVLGPALIPPKIRLVWNASSSVAKGLYLVLPAATLRRGDMVLARAPSQARRVAAERRYIPFNVPLIKRVSGLPRERLCAAGSIVTIGGRKVATRRQRDPRGRPLRTFEGCRQLGRYQYLLLGTGQLSFDGRYFGPSERRDIIGRARPLWAR